jgi:hypothetical protein
MPPNRAANVRRKVRYTDAQLRRAMVHLSDILTTVGPQHPELGGMIYAYLTHLDALRANLLGLYRFGWGGTERGLWNPEDFDIIIAGGKLIPDPSERA